MSDQDEKRRCLIRPHGWHEDVEAHVDPNTMAASHFDTASQVGFDFPCGTYELLDVYDTEDPVGEPAECTCSTCTLMTQGCVCGAIQRYRVPR